MKSWRYGARTAILTLVIAGAFWQGSERRAIEARSGHGLAQPPVVAANLGETLSVGQFNIRRGRAPGGGVDLVKTKSCLEDLELVGLNEVAGPHWFEIVPSQARSLAEMLDLGWLFAPSERRYWREHFGNALLSSAEIDGWQLIPLPHQRSKSRRSLLRTSTQYGGRDVTLFITHLDSGPDRAAQLEFLLARFTEMTGPAILLGDLNTRADDPLIAKWLSNAGLTVATAGEDSVDWLIAKDFRIAESRICDVGASDHPALLVELQPTWSD